MTPYRCAGAGPRAGPGLGVRPRRDDGQPALPLPGDARLRHACGLGDRTAAARAKIGAERHHVARGARPERRRDAGGQRDRDRQHGATHRGGAVLYETTAQAIADLETVYAATARPRDIRV